MTAAIAPYSVHAGIFLAQTRSRQRPSTGIVARSAKEYRRLSRRVWPASIAGEPGGTIPALSASREIRTPGETPGGDAALAARRGDGPAIADGGGGALNGEKIAARIRPTVQHLMAQDLIPGMGVSVSYKGHVLLTKGYGEANVATGAPVKANTDFEIASITKTFTAEALLLLVQRPRLIKEHGIRRLNLNAPISNYLKDEGGFNLPATWANVTTRELLNMSSGIAEIKFDPMIPWYDVINDSAPNNLLFQPGTQYLYSNANTWLAGEMIAQLSGQTYEQFVTSRIFRPLGMTHTSFIGPEPLLPGQATGYEYVNGQLVQPAIYAGGDFAYASGSIVSTAQDMGKYLAGLQQRRILSPSMYKTMWTPTPLHDFGFDPMSIAMPGLGWDDYDSIQVHSERRAQSSPRAAPSPATSPRRRSSRARGMASACSAITAPSPHPDRCTLLKASSMRSTRRSSGSPESHTATGRSDDPFSCGPARPVWVAPAPETEKEEQVPC